MEHVSEETWQFYRQFFNSIVDTVNGIPGTDIIIKYIHNSYQNDPWRLFLECLLIVILLNYLFSRQQKIKHNPIKLSKKEVDDLVKEWQPEPFAPPLSEEDKLELDSLPVLSGPASIVAKVNGEDKINFGSFNFLGYVGDDSFKKVAQQALRKYGVGSCGPPGFYGTIDVHTELEKKCASFLGTDDAILYSFGFATVSSCIPAFCKRGDLVISDQNVNFAIQKGLNLSRAQIKYFKHNDVGDLERILEDVRKDDAKNKRPINRRFIVIEGLYQNSGDLAPLKQIVELKKKYKYRLIVEESMSLGVLGKNGRGLTEHLGVPASDVEMICAGLGNSLGAAGGICAGPVSYVDHQILSGQGYCYSASMPALLAASALEGIKRLENQPEMIERLRKNTTTARQLLKDLPYLMVTGDEVSPLIHLRLKHPLDNRFHEELFLQSVVNEALAHGVLLTRAKYVLKEELALPRPSIRFTVSQTHTEEQIHKGVETLRGALQHAASNFREATLVSS